MAETDPKLAEAIAFFEQMLQTMPDDRTSLEFLVVAYEQVGAHEKRRDCLVRLAETLLHERDFEKAQAIAARLSAFPGDPAAIAAADRILQSIQGQILTERPVAEKLWKSRVAPVAASGPAVQPRDSGLEIHALSRSASAAEMELVWLWKEREFLPKDVCMQVLDVLTERPVSDVPFLISAFALLDELHPELTDGLLERMQRASEMPPVPLELFELPPEVFRIFDPNFVHVKGVLPFGLLAEEPLVALLNPLHPALQEETEARAGKVCHFFLAHPRVWRQVAQSFV